MPEACAVEYAETYPSDCPIRSGGGGLWQRFESYATTGLGGNKELRWLLDAKGTDYAKHFQYAMLEIADSHATVEFIVERESYWKNVLLTRKFGYNSN